jgi:hypothetical protein
LTELTKILFSEEEGLFKQASGVTYLPSSYRKNEIPKDKGKERHELLELYRFTGKLIAKSMIDKVPINVKLNHILLT